MRDWLASDVYEDKYNEMNKRFIRNNTKDQSNGNS